MKKKLYVVMFLMMMLVLVTSCNSDSGGISEDPRITELKATISDPMFWESAESEAALIAGLPEDDIGITISFRLDIDGATVIPSAYSVRLTDQPTKDQSTQIVNELVYLLATCDEVTNAIENNQAVSVTGVIASWTDPEIGKEISACDLDADAVWDYGAVGDMKFTYLPSGTFGIGYEATSPDSDEYVALDESSTSANELTKLILKH